MKKKNTVNLLTKEYIVTALIDLMLTKPYESISITDITKRAGVSRMAYYRNYISKDDILNQYMEEVGERIHQALSEADFKTNTHMYFRTILMELGQHSDIGLATYRAHLSFLIYNNLKKYMKETFFPGDTSTDSDYIVSGYAGAFYTIFLRWILTNKREDPDQLAEICCRVIPLPRKTDR